MFICPATFFPGSAARGQGPETRPSVIGACRRGPNSGPISRYSGGDPRNSTFLHGWLTPTAKKKGRLATWQWWHFWRGQISCLVPCVSCLMYPVFRLVPRVYCLLSRARTRDRRQEAQAIRPERCDTGRFRDMGNGVLEETRRTRHKTGHTRHKTKDLRLQVQDARHQPHQILKCLRTV